MKEREIRDRNALSRYLELVRQDVGRYFADPSELTAIPCPACGGGGHVTQFDKAGFRYVSCRSCGTLFVNPRPGREQLDRFYRESPSTRFWVHEFFAPVAEARREKIFRPRARALAERLPADSVQLVGDIGAGFGLFLEELRRFWPHAGMLAIEPSPEMADICRSKGLAVEQCTVEQLQGRHSQFDLLTAYELLEHMHEPKELVHAAWRILRPGGRLVVTTLNGEGFDIQVLWEQSQSVFPPHHLNFFNPKSLAGLLESAGFVVGESSTAGGFDRSSSGKLR